MHIRHNARLIVFGIIFIKMNIKEQEGRQFQGVLFKYSKFAQRAWRNEVVPVTRKYTKGDKTHLQVGLNPVVRVTETLKKVTRYHIF